MFGMSETFLATSTFTTAYHMLKIIDYFPGLGRGGC